jgi:hypothetical protein
MLSEGALVIGVGTSELLGGAMTRTAMTEPTPNWLRTRTPEQGALPERPMQLRRDDERRHERIDGT